jgi:Spy/CpxP family protein refolding chaperone
MGLGPRIAAELDLSEEQRAAIRQIRAEAREDLAPAREDLREMRGQLQGLWQADEPDARAILAQHVRMDALRSVVRDRMVDVRTAISEVLTPSQRQELAELRSSRSRRGQGHHGRRGRGGGIGRMAQHLELSADQQAQIQALRAQAREATREARGELRQVRQALRAQQVSGQPDSSSLEALRGRADAARQVIREQRVHTRIAVLGLLTDDQRSGLRDLAARRHAQRGQRQGRGAHPAR